MRSIAPKKTQVEPPESSSWVAVYSGRQCLGHVLSRGRAGAEAFDVNDKSIGLYPDFQAAADAISQVAS
jgi:hypothetical protein